jgi:hypothetical protein
MSAPLAEAHRPETTHQAIEPDAALARKNTIWAWLLVALFLALFGGTFGIAFVYLWLS